MSRHLRFAFVAWTAISLAVPVLAAAAPSSRFQLQAEGLWFSPRGSFAAARGVDAADFLPGGPGFAVSAAIALTSRIAVAARAGYLWGAYRKDPRLRFPDGGGTAVTDTVTYYAARRRLESVPVEVLLQYRRPMTRALGVYAEGGAGIMMFTEHLSVSLNSTPLFAIIGYQRSFSFTAGAGVITGYLPKVELTAGVSFHQANPSDGDVWRSSDNPKFLSACLGIRYPRP